MDNVGGGEARHVAIDAIIARILPLAIRDRHVATLRRVTRHAPRSIERIMFLCADLLVRIVAGDAAKLAGAGLEALARGASGIRLDFAQVGELNSTVLAVLASFARQVGEERPAPAIELCRVGPAVRMVLGVAGLGNVLGMGR